VRVIIDTDMGIDDAVALLMILGHPTAQIEAITSVVGNISLAQATHNVGVVLNAAGAAPIPLYRGCAKPLMQTEPLHAMDFHGSDGLGGASNAYPGRNIEAEHATLALIRLARENSGQLTLLTLGPLTNIALALRLAPDFLGHFERIVMMAGSVDGRGNTTPAAEFNIAVDPEAAKIVFAACQKLIERVWLVSWEVSLTHATPLETWQALIKGTSPQAQFVQAMTVYIEQTMAEGQVASIAWADPLAAAVALAPEIISATDPRFVEVEAGHNLARGGTIVNYLSRSNIPPNINIVRAVNHQQFEDLLRLAVQ
jgi:purine nucleosidase